MRVRFFNVFVLPHAMLNSRPFHMHKHKCAANRITTLIHTHISHQTDIIKKGHLSRSVAFDAISAGTTHVCVSVVQVKVGVNLIF